jgi:low affinity Fe/Cu permease
MTNKFAAFARRVSDLAGRPLAFILACLLVAIWAATGPLFDWSDSHSLVINTITTVITFLMVFCLQGTSNRDAAAAQAKLDAIICALDKADNKLIGIEGDTEQHLQEARINKP